MKNLVFSLAFMLIGSFGFASDLVINQNDFSNSKRFEIIESVTDGQYTTVKYYDTVGCWNYWAVYNRAGDCVASGRDWDPDCTTSMSFTGIQLR